MVTKINKDRSKRKVHKNSIEKEVVEDLIIAAIKDAKDKADKLMQDEMAKMTEGLGLPPGMKLPF